MSTTRESSAATLDERPPQRLAPFPFAELLDALRQQQIPIGLSDYQSVARLLDRWNGGSIPELRTAIAALLATNADQIAVVLETFDALYLRKPADDTPPPTARRRRPRIRPWHAGAAAALILLAVLAIRAYWSIPAPPEPGPPVNAGPVTPSFPQEPIPPPPALPAPPIVRDTTLLLLLAAFAGGAMGAALWAVRARTVQTKSLREAWRQLLATLPGPFYYKTALTPVLSPGMRRAVGDAATILGRRFVESVLGDELDVEESLAKTLKAGMRPVLVFKEPPLPAPIVILRDVGAEMRVWNGKVDAFVDRLEVSGVLVECWYFDEDASFVSRTPYGRAVPLASLAARHDDSALLVISSGAGVPLALERPGGSWLTVLEAWEDRAWLTPINHPLYWRRELRKPGTLPLPIYPMTRSGVVATARALTGGDITSAVRPSPDVRSVGADDVERMKRLIALVPYPTLELAERLRQRYLPTVPEEVLLFLAGETEGRSSQIIRLDDGDIRRLVAAERRDDPDQELEVRRFLKDVLDRSEPAAGSAAHLRWQLDRAIQQLHLSTLAPGEHARPTESLQRLADGPLGDEVRRAIGVASSAAAPSAEKHIQRLEKRKWTLPRETADGAAVKIRWAWPGFTEAILAALVAAIAYAAFTRWSPFAATIAEHRLDAYALEWIAPTSPDQPGSLIGSRVASDTDGSIPANPDIYRDNTRVGPVTGLATTTSRSVSTIGVDQTGAYYQLRATLPSGNLAVSNAVWVPTARAETKPPPSNPDLPVAVTVDLQPWARVRILSQGGASSGSYQTLPTTPLLTPFTITLLPGDYVMECENGGITAPLSLQVSVASGQNQFISRAMPGFDPRRVVDALLGQAAK